MYYKLCLKFKSQLIKTINITKLNITMLLWCDRYMRKENCDYYLNKYLELIINYSKFYINISHSMRKFYSTTHSTIVIALLLKLKTNYNVHVLIWRVRPNRLKKLQWTLESELIGYRLTSLLFARLHLS